MDSSKLFPKQCPALRGDGTGWSLLGAPKSRNQNSNGKYRAGVSVNADKPS